MKLSFCIPDKVYWITNFLDYNMYKGIHDAIIKERNKINLHSSEGKWSDDLIANIVPPLRVGVSKYQPFDQLKTLVRHNAFFKMDNLIEMNTNIHYMKKGSGINWHDDSGWKYGATLYINHKWSKQWGGEFRFFNGQEKSNLSEGEAMLFPAEPIWIHGTEPVTKGARYSINCFLKQ